MRAGSAPPPLWERRARVERVLAAPRLLACFDYDGTLVGIRSTPEEAVADRVTRSALQRLAALPGTRVAVVSGRAVAALRELLGEAAGPVWLAGMHGLELAAPGEPAVPSVDLAACAAALEPLRREGERLAARYPGVRGEDKGATYALHTRLAARSDAAAALAAFREAAGRVGGFVVAAGKEVLEARPVGVDKGTVVRQLLARYPGAAVLYVGDDVTDEDAFAALARARAAVTVRVGDEEEQQRPGGGGDPAADDRSESAGGGAPPVPAAAETPAGRTAAAYRLAGQREVTRLLGWLLALRGGRSG